jgi:hypothetical protein
MEGSQLTTLIIAQLPNFVGLLVCVAFQWKQNQELLKLLKDCMDDTGGPKQAS